MASSAKAFETNEDGSAKDPSAYRAALMADPAKMKAIQVRAGCAQAGRLRRSAVQAWGGARGKRQR